MNAPVDETERLKQRLDKLKEEQIKLFTRLNMEPEQSIATDKAYHDYMKLLRLH